MSWLIINENTGQQVGEHKTKKKATEQAAEMQIEHEKIGALHDGRPIGFKAVKNDVQAESAEGD